MNSNCIPLCLSRDRRIITWKMEAFIKRSNGLSERASFAYGKYKQQQNYAKIITNACIS